jgi:protein involved in polysaccharide export with SLBB domain
LLIFTLLEILTDSSQGLIFLKGRKEMATHVRLIGLLLFMAAVCHVLAGCGHTPEVSRARAQNPPPPPSTRTPASAPVDDTYYLSAPNLPAAREEPAVKKVAATKPKKMRPAYSPNYTLAPGDEIELIYQFSNSAIDVEYRIRIRDQIGLTLVHAPSYNRTLAVRSDGKVDLPLVGETLAVGKTLAELEKEIEALYVGKMEKPQVELHSASYVTPDDELKQAVYSNTFGYSRRMPVRSDGYVSLPLLDDVRAGGRTVMELSREIESKYASKGMDNVSVTVVLASSLSSVAYVLGEVPSQGPLHLRGPIDVWRAIAEAGGFKPEADRKNVVVARTTDGEEQRFLVNFETWRQGADANQNVLIEPGDIIYVSKPVKRYVYVAGEVRSPGRVEMDDDSEITVSQAVAMGGGITIRGTREQALLLKETSSGEPVVIEINLDAVYDPEKRRGNLDPLQPIDPQVEAGDIVYVPSSLVGDMNRFAQKWFRDGIWTIVPFTTSVTYQRTDLK